MGVNLCDCVATFSDNVIFAYHDYSVIFAYHDFSIPTMKPRQITLSPTKRCLITQRAGGQWHLL
jgi:hypothetical protein